MDYCDHVERGVGIWLRNCWHSISCPNKPRIRSCSTAPAGGLLYQRNYVAGTKSDRSSSAQMGNNWFAPWRGAGNMDAHFSQSRRSRPPNQPLSPQRHRSSGNWLPRESKPDDVEFGRCHRWVYGCHCSYTSRSVGPGYESIPRPQVSLDLEWMGNDDGNPFCHNTRLR